MKVPDSDESNSSVIDHTQLSAFTRRETTRATEPGYLSLFASVSSVVPPPVPSEEGISMAQHEAIAALNRLSTIRGASRAGGPRCL